MTKAVFKSTSGGFLRKNESFKDMLMAHMAMDIEVIIKTGGRTPVDTGDLKAEVRHFKSRNDSYRVEADKEYAAVQEAGIRSGTRPFKNYTTSGTGRGWFRSAIDQVVKNRDNYVDEVRRALSL